MLKKTRVYTKLFNEITPKDFDLVGIDAVELSEIFSVTENVPLGFCLSSTAFDDFLIANNLIEPILSELRNVKPFFKETAIAASGVISNLILSSKFPDLIAADILEKYNLMSRGNDNTFVTLTYSRILDDEFLPKRSENRITETSGFNNILGHIKFLWRDIFSASAIEARANKSYEGALSTAINIKKLVKSDISGTSYSIPPITKEDNTIEVHAIFGINDPTDYITPDAYKVDIETAKVSEKVIVEQDYMLVKKGGEREKENFDKIQLSEEWRKTQKVEDEKILAIASQHLQIEQLLKKPIVVDWAYETGTFYTIDVRALKLAEIKNNNEDLQSKYDEAVEEEKSKTSEVVEKKVQVEKKPNLKTLQKEIEDIISENGNEIDKHAILEKKNQLKMLKVEKTKPDIDPKELKRVSIGDEFKIDTKLILDISEINSTNINALKYFDGGFYDGTELLLNNDVLPESLIGDESATNALIESYSIDIGILAESAGGDNIIYQFSNIGDEEKRLLNQNSNSSNYSGDERFIDKPEALLMESLAVKKAIRNSGLKNLSISFPGVRNIVNLKDLISIVSKKGLKRRAGLKYYAEVSIPSFVHELKNLDENLVDGLIVNYDVLLRLLVYRSEVRDIDHFNIINILEELQIAAFNRNLEIIIRLSNVPLDILEKLKELSITGIIFEHVPSEKELETLATAK
ncbi:MAG: PEP/pyruvate-binding domain-containing protein [Candidatus Dojkabacteria bacterium]|nr:PEP/pyruvate-binding domain-containing protein [Candidatus Dojkabacteria bacterium]MDQ7020785.1 PEP/pyruvate-binding domain-containing protein [Candidatus Dojkabacteria bacterium]